MVVSESPKSFPGVTTFTSSYPPPAPSRFDTIRPWKARVCPAGSYPRPLQVLVCSALWCLESFWLFIIFRQAQEIHRGLPWVTQGSPIGSKCVKGFFSDLRLPQGQNPV